MASDAVECLSRVDPFSVLPPPVIEATAALLQLVTFPSGEVLALQGRTTLEDVYIVRSGALELFFDSHGRKTLYGTLGPGEVFGAISILMNAGLAVRSLVVLKDAEVYRMPKEVFLSLCARHPAIAEHYSGAFTQRMQNEGYAAALAASQLTHFLWRHPPFSFLPEDELRLLPPHLSRVAFPADQVIFTQGESRVDGLYIVQSGSAERYFEQNRSKTLLGILGEGEMFGGISMLLNDMLAVRTLRTVEETTFCRLDSKAFLDLCRRHDAFREFFTDAFGKRMMDRSYAAIMAKGTTIKVDAAAPFSQSVSEVCSRALLSCAADLPVQGAAELMSRRRCSSIFVRDAGGSIVGIVTDNDLRRKVLAEGRSALVPVSDVMSSPLQGIRSDAPVFEALMAMIRHRIKHLAVTDDHRQVVGVLTNRDVLGTQSHSPLVLIRDVAAAGSVEAVRQVHLRLPRVVDGLIRAGTPAEHLNVVIAAFSDAVLKRVCELLQNDMESPPVRFAFLVLGSEGRREQTLATDQDNAIVYEDPTPGAADYVNEYFLRFGRAVCGALDRCGFRLCRANVMAGNPALCRPLSVWKRRFDEWIHAAEAEDLLYASIFFDFRAGYGQAEVAEGLRSHLFESLVGWSGFFRHLTQNALLYKPPLGFFRNFVLEPKGEHRNTLDIKQSMMPIVDYARVYALKHGIAETNTLQRIRQLTRRGVVPAKETGEIEQGYGFLMQLRLVRQAAAILEKDMAPHNHINPSDLSGIEQRLLKEIFIRIGNVQTRMSFDFTGEP